MKFATTVDMLKFALEQAELRHGRTRKMVAKKSGIAYNTIGAWLRSENTPEFYKLKSVISACGFHINYDMEAK